MRLAFTATRHEHRDSRARIVRRLTQLDEPEEVTTGGAAFGDQVIAQTAIVLWPEAFHRLVLPAKYDHGFVTWFEQGIIALQFRGEVLRTGMEPLKRNHVILDHGDMLEAFPFQWSEPASARAGGGTWATIRYARKRQMPMWTTPVGPVEV